MGSLRFRCIPAADRRRSETDTRPMLDPREGRGEVVPGETADGLRRGREDEVEEERDGGSEFKSGDMLNSTMKRTMFKGSSFKETTFDRGLMLSLGSGHDHQRG